MLLAVGCGDPTRDTDRTADDERAGVRATVAALVEDLGSEDDERRDKALAALEALGPTAVDPLAAGLADARERVREGAIEVLGRLASPATVPPLLGVLADASAELRVAALEALARTHDARAVEPVLARYGRDEDAQVRYECLTTLGVLGDARAVPLLVKETTNADPYARMWAMDALCVMRAPAAARLAAALTRDPDPRVRRQVLRSCGATFDGADAGDALLDAALGDDDFESAASARQTLADHLRRSGDARARAAAVDAARAGLRGAGREAVRAALLLGDLGEREATDGLVDALRDPDAFVRHHAAHLLARVRDPRAVPALVRALDDPEKLVRATAYSSLQWYADDGDARAREAVARYTGEKFSERLPR